MRPTQARFVTACQQLLALGVVLAVLTPAASVVTLDVVRRGSRGHRRGARSWSLCRRTSARCNGSRCSPTRR